ncbi:stress response translation initiation inhibitor YciH [Chitinivibrio alkaliphilus]|uniref:Translation initiation factor SUI1 n=1 Tax=Chitinivibrio alkaliphilus ACht1 TaxID=1313304 RepID=U7D9J7_9BACT|nr:stress response translation initiation inhibitor YciH [Chitinivibrio alkaliphilus]ERP38697.1 translation initiation factor SUI1 [Chitinivibrio alkaliphilus ACht1]
MSSSLVYSTDSGRVCPQCEQPQNRCECKQQSSAHTAPQGVVYLRRETKGRKGKGVTCITGLALSDMACKLLAKELKQTCGCGGTVRNGEIEIQGDVRTTLKKILEKKGYVCKIAGA